MNFVSKVGELLATFPFEHHGVTALSKPLSMDVYREWIADGNHGEMAYLEEHVPLKSDTRKLAPRARTAIVIAKSYQPHPYGKAKLGLRTAMYAQGEDYHVRFKEELQAVARRLGADFPDEEFLCFTDSGPILERDLAYRAGLGWVGKNTCLIHPKHGSLFFLGQILTSIAIDSSPDPIADFCGTCDRCIRACPTQAIEAPRKLNATKCISYWTIESREAAPEALRERFGDWLFGCDICQTVCPWNEKRHGKDLMRELTEPGEATREEDLRWLLSSSNRAIERALGWRSPLLRAGPRNLKRNALVIVGNGRLNRLRPEVEALKDDARLKDIARWALARLT